MILIPDSSNSVVVLMLKLEIPIALQRPDPNQDFWCGTSNPPSSSNVSISLYTSVKG